MKIELAHDFIAKKIYEEASIEDKQRVKAVKYLQERYTYYESSPDLLLTENDLNYIKPHLDEMDLSTKEMSYVTRSKKIIKNEKTKTKIKNYSMIVLSCTIIFGSFSMWQHNKFVHAQSQLSFAKDSIQVLKRNIKYNGGEEGLSVIKSSFSPIKLTGNVQNKNGEQLDNCKIKVLGVDTKTKADGSFELHLILSPKDMEAETFIQISKLGYVSTTRFLDTDLHEMHFDVVLEK